MPFGIALAGGGARGAAHIGVLLALEEERLFPRSIAGTSAGALVAGLYATGSTPEAMKAMVQEISDNADYFLDLDLLGILRSVPQLACRRTFTLSGLIKGKRMERYLTDRTGGKNIRDAQMRTVIPAVDLTSGNTISYTNTLENLRPVEGVVWKSGVPIAEAMRASAAYPGVFQPKWIDEMCLVDGGVTDVLPVDLLMAAGENNVLAVDLGAEYEPPKTYNVLEINTHSLSIMQTRLKECRSQGEKLLLVPKLPKSAGLLTLGEMDECVTAGYNAARAQMPKIRALFR